MGLMLLTWKWNCHCGYSILNFWGHKQKLVEMTEIFHTSYTKSSLHDSCDGRYLICILPRWPLLPKVEFMTFESKRVEPYLGYIVPLISGWRSHFWGFGGGNIVLIDAEDSLLSYMIAHFTEFVSFRLFGNSVMVLGRAVLLNQAERPWNWQLSDKRMLNWQTTRENDNIDGNELFGWWRKLFLLDQFQASACVTA